MNNNNNNNNSNADNNGNNSNKKRRRRSLRSSRFTSEAPSPGRIIFPHNNNNNSNSLSFNYQDEENGNSGNNNNDNNNGNIDFTNNLNDSHINSQFNNVYQIDTITGKANQYLNTFGNNGVINTQLFEAIQKIVYYGASNNWMELEIIGEKSEMTTHEMRLLKKIGNKQCLANYDIKIEWIRRGNRRIWYIFFNYGMEDPV
jgi:hypothetical protein